MNKRNTVFLVDDDASVKKALVRALKLHGLHVEAYDSTESFLTAVTPSCRGCLLCDVNMPEMNGLELQNELLKRGISLPIIFTTGDSSVSAFAQAFKAGAIDFPEKPINQAMLLQRIEDAFAQDRANARQANKQKHALVQFSFLSSREKDVLELIVGGFADLSNREIAHKLGISKRTVEHHRAQILNKTAARSLIHLARLVDAAGLARMDK